MANLTKALAKQIIAAVERGLKAGGKPPHEPCVSKERRATSIAAEEMGYHRTKLMRLIPEIKRQYGLEPDWSLWKAAEQPSKEPVEHITLRRLKDRLASAESRAAAAERAAISNETLREGIFRLAGVPLEPRPWSPATTGPGSNRREAIVAFLSDLHMGEVIDFDAMGGRNSFDQEICGARLERLFQTIVRLGTVHWSGPPPGVIYVVLGGDLISGEIHEELAKSNDLLAIPAVRELSTHLISGLELLLKSFDCEIRVISVPGNHGRSTKKFEAKNFVLTSYDTLTAWLVESWFTSRETPRISFTAPASGDAVVEICGWRFLFTHGDRIGSRGGMGMIGPAATVSRGMQRLIQDYAADNVVIDHIMIGHFHSPMELEQGIVNGSLSGPSEYSRSGRMRSHPASQWMISVHPEHGICRRWKIGVGVPKEGSIYRGRAKQDKP